MELLLNTIWLVVAAGAFVWWVPRPGTIANRFRGSSLPALALACALVLLFPAISVTDDLHAEQVAMEDSSRTSMKARAMAQECQRTGRPNPVLAPPLLLCTDTGSRVLAMCRLTLGTPAASLAAFAPLASRAPPCNA